VLLFLSYAEEDKDVARTIAGRLINQNVTVYPPQNGHVREADTEDLARAINQADAFLALLSPSFLASNSCRREHDLALHREQRGKANGAAADFVQVLQIRETPLEQAGLLKSRPWFDLTSLSDPDTVLTRLADKIESTGSYKPGDGDAHPTDADRDGQSAEPGRHPGSAQTGGGAARPPAGSRHHATGWPGFRNREQELDDILGGLRSMDGQHFWLLIGPPELGKTWLLDRISEELRRGEPGRWEIRRLDLCEYPAVDAGSLLTAMFGVVGTHPADPEYSRAVAVGLVKARKRNLCIIDSAELLDDRNARSLRACIAEISQLVDARNNNGTRLALIVASRRDGQWSGIIPRPRLQRVALTKFKDDVIREALGDLSDRMFGSGGPIELRQIAQLVHTLSEGLPALLVEYLHWIRAEAWVDWHRMETPQMFDQLAVPYVEHKVLAPDRLRGRVGDLTDQQLAAIWLALKAIVPYRFFTTSHLRHYAESGELHEAIHAADWSVENLWAAVTTTNLLVLPQDEPWQVIHPPIRRLLCRYWYRTDGTLAQAHANACRFVQSWNNGKLGKDQSRFLVECLWHAASALRLGAEPAAERDEKLITLAREMSLALEPSETFDLATLRRYAVHLLREDEELDTVDGVEALIDRLAGAIEAPE
jgi:hypothetical protein